MDSKICPADLSTIDFTLNPIKAKSARRFIRIAPYHSTKRLSIRAQTETCTVGSRVFPANNLHGLGIMANAG
ncbi:hypothetical protein HDV63DRAFT_381104 [Trichoderma sp. SZMC 28014]